MTPLAQNLPLKSVWDKTSNFFSPCGMQSRNPCKHDVVVEEVSTILCQKHFVSDVQFCY